MDVHTEKFLPIHELLLENRNHHIRTGNRTISYSRNSSDNLNPSVFYPDLIQLLIYLFLDSTSASVLGGCLICFPDSLLSYHSLSSFVLVFEFKGQKTEDENEYDCNKLYSKSLLSKIIGNSK